VRASPLARHKIVSRQCSAFAIAGHVLGGRDARGHRGDVRRVSRGLSGFV
jgi:hypothetical protein